MDAGIAFLLLITFVGVAVGFALWQETNGTETERRDGVSSPEPIPSERLTLLASEPIHSERVTLRYAALILLIGAATGVVVSAAVTVAHVTGAWHRTGAIGVTHRQEILLVLKVCLVGAGLLTTSHYLYAIWGRLRGGRVVLSPPAAGPVGRIILQAVGSLFPYVNTWFWFDHASAVLITATMLLLYAFGLYTTVASTLLREDGIWRGSYYTWHQIREYIRFEPLAIARVSGFSYIMLRVRAPVFWPLPFARTQGVIVPLPEGQREAVERVLQEHVTVARPVVAGNVETGTG